MICLVYANDIFGRRARFFSIFFIQKFFYLENNTYTYMQYEKTGTILPTLKRHLKKCPLFSCEKTLFCRECVFHSPRGKFVRLQLDEGKLEI